MLDLFSGLGGASQVMKARGWRVVTVDVEPRFAPDIVADIGTWSWTGDRPDLLWASPPCTEFARESMPWCRTGKTPDLSLVNAVHRIVSECRPVWWVLENVKGAQRWLGPARFVRNPVYLWGEFPPITCGPLAPWKERLSSTRDAERAMIPRQLSEAIADAIEQSFVFRPEGA